MTIYLLKYKPSPTHDFIVQGFVHDKEVAFQILETKIYDHKPQKCELSSAEMLLNMELPDGTALAYQVEEIPYLLTLETR